MGAVELLCRHGSDAAFDRPRRDPTRRLSEPGTPTGSAASPSQPTFADRDCSVASERPGTLLSVALHCFDNFRPAMGEDPAGVGGCLVGNDAAEKARSMTVSGPRVMGLASFSPEPQ